MGKLTGTQSEYLFLYLYFNCIGDQGCKQLVKADWNLKLLMLGTSISKKPGIKYPSLDANI